MLSPVPLSVALSLCDMQFSCFPAERRVHSSGNYEAINIATYDASKVHRVYEDRATFAPDSKSLALGPLIALALRTGGNLSFCTGIAVAPGRVLTVRHFFPEVQRAIGSPYQLFVSINIHPVLNRDPHAWLFFSVPPQLIETVDEAQIDPLRLTKDGVSGQPHSEQCDFCVFQLSKEHLRAPLNNSDYFQKLLGLPSAKFDPHPLLPGEKVLLAGYNFFENSAIAAQLNPRILGEAEKLNPEHLNFVPFCLHVIEGRVLPAEILKDPSSLTEIATYSNPTAPGMCGSIVFRPDSALIAAMHFRGVWLECAHCARATGDMRCSCCRDPEDRIRNRRASEGILGCPGCAAIQMEWHRCPHRGIGGLALNEGIAVTNRNLREFLARLQLDLSA